MQVMERIQSLFASLTRRDQSSPTVAPVPTRDETIDHIADNASTEAPTAQAASDNAADAAGAPVEEGGEG